MGESDVICWGEFPTAAFCGGLCAGNETKIVWIGIKLFVLHAVSSLFSRELYGIIEFIQLETATRGEQTAPGQRGLMNIHNYSRNETR
jgi:hypothetical protein